MRHKSLVAVFLAAVVILGTVGLVVLQNGEKRGEELASRTEDSGPPEASGKQVMTLDAAFAVRTGSAVDRKVIEHTQMAVEVARLDEAQAEVLRITTAFGGYVQSSSFLNLTDNQAWDFTLRVPGATSAEVVRLLQALGSVQSSSSNRQDVTEEYTDLEARLTVMRQEEARLLELLRRANTIDDYLKVESHLTRVRIEIEQATGRLKLLAHNVEMATIGIRLTPARGAIVPPPVGFAGLGKRLAAALRQGLNTVVELVSGALVLLAAGLPLLIILIPALVIVLLVYRRISLRRKPPAVS